MPTQTIDDAAVHYEEKGKGPLLILLHAFPVDSRMWQAQAEDLSSKYRVITPDFRGFGKSTGGGSFTVPSLAADIHQLARQLGEKKFVLGGLSMGGYVAMNYARMFPDDLAGLILADTKDAGDTPEQRENRNRMIEVARGKGASAIADLMEAKLLSPDTVSNRPATVKALRAMMESCPAETIAHALAALRDRPDMSGELSKIATPTLILVGEADAITGPEIAKGMHQKIAGSMLTIIPAAGHMTAMEQPTLVNQAIRTFMGIAKTQATSIPDRRSGTA